MEGQCIWITGLSAAGKTTVSKALSTRLRARGRTVVVLDGDVVREVLQSKAYSKAERLALTYTYSRMSKMLAEQGVDVITAVIGLFHEIHKWNRKNIPNYTEVFLDVPISELMNRDPKGIYERARKGEVTNVAGIDLAVEFPESPDFHYVWNEHLTVEQIVEELSDRFFLKERPNS